MSNWDKKPPAGTTLPTHEELIQQRWPVARSGAVSANSASSNSSEDRDPRVDWEVHPAEFDSKKQRQTIYYNKKSGISTYEKPDCLKTAVELARDSSSAEGESAMTVLAKVRAAEAQDQLEEEDRRGSGNMPRNEMSGYLDPNAFQQASLDVAIGSENRGYRLLEKMGWKKGTGLGKQNAGMLAPLNPLGRVTQDIKNGGMGQQVGAVFFFCLCRFVFIPNPIHCI